MVQAMGIESVSDSGQDPFSSYKMLKHAAAEVRSTGAPYFLEFSTYRWREHCGHSFDNDIGYRTQDEFLEWQLRDPLNNLERELLLSDPSVEASLKKIKSEVSMEIAAAFDFAETSLFPPQSDAYDGVYA
jgi:pyruvate dehydrogenase E1 component alpha subunit